MQSSVPSARLYHRERLSTGRELEGGCASYTSRTIDRMPDDAPRPGLLEIIAGLSGLLDDLDRGRLTRHLRTPSRPIDVDDAVDVLSIAAHDLDAIAEDLTHPWAIDGHACPDRHHEDGLPLHRPHA